MHATFLDQIVGTRQRIMLLDSLSALVSLSTVCFKLLVLQLNDVLADKSPCVRATAVLKRSPTPQGQETPLLTVARHGCCNATVESLHAFGLPHGGYAVAHALVISSRHGLGLHPHLPIISERDKKKDNNKKSDNTLISQCILLKGHAEYEKVNELRAIDNLSQLMRDCSTRFRNFATRSRPTQGRE